MNGSRMSVLAVAALVVAASPAATSSAPAVESQSLRGGTYRVGWPTWQGRLGWSYGFDPTAEFHTTAGGIYSNLLLRTLVGYNHVAGAAGRQLVPDLAVGVPAPTNGGRTYRFTLKRGIRFGPPVNRVITSSDVRYAVERLVRRRNGSEWAPAFGDIRGFDAYRSGRARSISGISTPNARDIAFTLDQPTGDFLNRLALPPAAPIPPEVGKCFEGRLGDYGSHVISSGPYMIDGSGAMSIRSCRAIRPIRGISPTQLTLVRNPRYDPSTDSTAARESNPDRFVFVADPEHQVQSAQAAEAARRLAAGGSRTPTNLTIGPCSSAGTRRRPPGADGSGSTRGASLSGSR